MGESNSSRQTCAPSNSQELNSSRKLFLARVVRIVKELRSSPESASDLAPSSLFQGVVFQPSAEAIVVGFRKQSTEGFFNYPNIFSTFYCIFSPFYFFALSNIVLYTMLNSKLFIAFSPHPDLRIPHKSPHFHPFRPVPRLQPKCTNKGRKKGEIRGRKRGIKRGKRESEKRKKKRDSNLSLYPFFLDIPK